MKRMQRLFYLSLLFYTTSFLFLPKNVFSNSGSGDATNWVTVTKSDGIEVQERWITIDKNIKVRERSGKMNLDCTEKEILALIADETKTHLWMSNVESVKLIKKVSENEWYVHTQLSAPWPFGKQDMVSKYEVITNQADKTVKVLISPVGNLLAKQMGVERLETFYAEWELKATERGKVKVSFTTKSTVPPEYPSWVQDPVVRKVFFANLRNFKSVLVKK